MNEQELQNLFEDILKFRRQNGGEPPKLIKVSPEYLFEVQRFDMYHRYVEMWSDGKRRIFGIPVEIDQELDGKAKYVLEGAINPTIHVASLWNNRP